jgi:hypothetical protein
MVRKEYLEATAVRILLSHELEMPSQGPLNVNLTFKPPTFNAADLNYIKGHMRRRATGFYVLQLYD